MTTTSTDTKQDELLAERPETAAPPPVVKDDAPTPSAPERWLAKDRTYRAVLLGILGVALALRLWHYDYEVGQSFTYDTGDKINQALRVARGELSPVNWKQPYFLPYSGGLLLALVQLFTNVDGRLAERVLTLWMIALSVGAVALTERAAARIFASRAVGITAALLLAVVPIEVIGARYVKEDMPLVFFVQLALLLLTCVIQRGKWLDYAGAGLAIGLAIGTKFSGVLLGPMLVLAHGLRLHSQAAPPKDWISRQVLLGLGAIALGFVLVNPFVVANAGEFLSGFAFQAKYSSGAHHDGTLVSPWTHFWGFYFRRALLPGLSVAVVLAALLALYHLASDKSARKNPALILLTVWTLLCYVAFERATAKPFPFFARYVHPMVPAVCMLAAWSLNEVRHWLTGSLKPKAVELVQTLALAGAVAWPLGLSVLISSAIGDDTRLVAARYIDEELPHGSKIAFDDPVYSPHPPKSHFDAKYFGLVSRRIYDESVDKLANKGFRYVVLNSFRTERFRVARHDSPEAERAHRFYESVREKARLVRTITPPYALQSYGFHNPVIQIYELQPK